MAGLVSYWKSLAITEIERAMDIEQFRRVMSWFATGVAIVTSRAGNQVHGMTCNAFCSVSIAPMSVLVSLSKESRTERMITFGHVFAVNILSESQRWLSDRFAGRHRNKDQNRFEGAVANRCDWCPNSEGQPSLSGLQII
jgi:flavin reductase (DIM6/NTAB) family NADH-FMN oxidoreductase RutF